MDSQQPKIEKKQMLAIKKKHLILSIILIILIFFIIIFVNPFNITNRFINDNKENLFFKEFNECLAENGVVIYGTHWCPACNQLVEMLGGHDAVNSVYVECTEEQQRCAEEAQTGYVPEIQIDGELYENIRTLEGFSEATGCPLPN